MQRSGGALLAAGLDGGNTLLCATGAKATSPFRRVPTDICFFCSTPKGWTRTLSAYHAEPFRRTSLPEWQQFLSLFPAIAAKRQLPLHKGAFSSAH